MTDRESIGVGEFAGREADARTLRDRLVKQPTKRTLRDRLAKQPTRVINRSGDRAVQAGQHMLISLAQTDKMPVFDLVGETDFDMMPDFVLRPIAIWLRSVRNQMIATGNRR